MQDSNAIEVVKATIPLGSIVYLRQGVVKMLIIGRFSLVGTSEAEKPLLFEYAAVPCPVGFSREEEIYYFNAEDIDRIVFRGFDNSDDEQLMRAVEEWKKDHSTEYEAGKTGKHNKNA